MQACRSLLLTTATPMQLDPVEAGRRLDSADQAGGAFSFRSDIDALLLCDSGQAGFRVEQVEILKLLWPNGAKPIRAAYFSRAKALRYGVCGRRPISTATKDRHPLLMAIPSEARNRGAAHTHQRFLTPLRFARNDQRAFFFKKMTRSG